MQFIVENYIILIIIGLFLVFALIGFLVDMLRKETNPKPINTPVNQNTAKVAKQIPINTEDNLLKNYEEEIKSNTVKQDN